MSNWIAYPIKQPIKALTFIVNLHLSAQWGLYAVVIALPPNYKMWINGTKGIRTAPSNGEVSKRPKEHASWATYYLAKTYRDILAMANDTDLNHQSALHGVRNNLDNQGSINVIPILFHTVYPMWLWLV